MLGDRLHPFGGGAFVVSIFSNLSNELVDIFADSWLTQYMEATTPTEVQITASELRPGDVLVTHKYTGYTTRRTIEEVTNTRRNTHYRTDADRNAPATWSGWVLPNEYRMKVER